MMLSDVVLLAIEGVAMAFGHIPQPFRRRLGASDGGANSTADDGAVAIDCPESIFAAVDVYDPAAVTLMFMGIVASLPVMGMGLFTCYFGANIRTVLVAAQAFAVIGIPLLLPTIMEMSATMTSVADLTPVYLTTLLAGTVSANNAMSVVLGASPTTRMKLIGLNTGFLLSGFFMGFWLPSVANAGMPVDQYNWVVMGGAAAPALAGVAVASQQGAHAPLSALSFGLIGAFLFIGPVNGWVGGGHISLLSLTTGSMGACAAGGWVTMSFLGVMIASGMYASLKQAAPPGPVQYLFAAVYRLEDRLNETPDEKKKRVDAKREKYEASLDPRFAALRKRPKTKADAGEFKDAFVLWAKEAAEKAKVQAKEKAAQAKVFAQELPEKLKGAAAKAQELPGLIKAKYAERREKFAAAKEAKAAGGESDAETGDAGGTGLELPGGAALGGLAAAGVGGAALAAKAPAAKDKPEKDKATEEAKLAEAAAAKAKAGGSKAQAPEANASANAAGVPGEQLKAGAAASGSPDPVAAAAETADGGAGVGEAKTSEGNGGGADGSNPLLGSATADGSSGDSSLLAERVEDKKPTRTKTPGPKGGGKAPRTRKGKAAGEGAAGATAKPTDGPEATTEA